jgi:tetrahydromethanopterin S-methyltransferase subunit B
MVSKTIIDGELTVAMAGLTELKSATIGSITMNVIDNEATAVLSGDMKVNANNSRDMNTLDIKQIPEVFKLANNYPNPFNPTTTIGYQLPENNKVVVNIYDMLGNKIRTLVNENKTAGYYSVVWNGLNDNGARISSGTYFYHIQAGTHNSTKKMLLIK